MKYYLHVASIEVNNIKIDWGVKKNYLSDNFECRCYGDVIYTIFLIEILYLIIIFISISFFVSLNFFVLFARVSFKNAWANEPFISNMYHHSCY